jgi:hypothetical protein
LGVRSSFSLKFLARFPLFCCKFLSTSSIACSFELGFCRKRILCLFFRRILVLRVTLGRARALAQALGNGFFFFAGSLWERCILSLLQSMFLRVSVSFFLKFFFEYSCLPVR